jgi:hypothetical protein
MDGPLRRLDGFIGRWRAEGTSYGEGQRADAPRASAVPWTSDESRCTRALPTRLTASESAIIAIAITGAKTGSPAPAPATSNARLRLDTPVTLH